MKRAVGAAPFGAPVDEDADLVRRLTTGDTSALGRLYDRHGRALYSLACRILSDPAEAEDVVQDVFSQAWRQADRYDGRRAAVAGWLVMMTRARAIDRLRARKSRPVSVDAEPIVHRQPDPGPGPEAAAVTTDAVARMRLAFAELSDVERRALDLAYFEGLSQSEIAETLRQPLGTVKTRIRTALQKLRTVMVRE